MTMNVDLGAPINQPGAGQSWCAGPMLRTTRSQTPSWLAPSGGFNEEHAAAESERPLLEIDADAESLQASASASAQPPMVNISLLPPATPVISLAPDPTPDYPDLRAENADLKRTVEALTRELSRVRKDAIESSEAELVRLACAVAERIVGEELSTDPGHIVAWAREGIDALDAKENVVVALAADLARALPNEEWSSLGANVTVEIDASLSPSSCEVRSRTGLVKVSAAARMAQMRSELGAKT
jgi:hypothetical protein